MKLKRCVMLSPDAMITLWNTLSIRGAHIQTLKLSEKAQAFFYS